MYKVNELKYPSKETIKRLTLELRLKDTDEYTQDWDYEVTNVNQLPDYIDFYKNNQLNLNEKSSMTKTAIK